MSNSLYIFDIDETLFTNEESLESPHYLIKNSSGKTIHRFPRIEKNFELPFGWFISYEEFSSSKRFVKTARPIKRMIKLINKLSEKNKDIVIVTARADFDDQFQFASFLLNHGIDISKIHVYRVGNMKNNHSMSERKKIQIFNLLAENKYKKCHFYDDNVDNLKAFLSLIYDYPNIEFVAHHIIHDRKTEKTNRVKIKC